MDGIELANRIKADWPHIPVMVTSGRVTPEAEVGDDFIAKPYNPDVVISHARALAA